MKNVYFWSLVALLVVIGTSFLCYRLVQSEREKRLVVLSYGTIGIDSKYLDVKLELDREIDMENRKGAAAEDAVITLAKMAALGKLNYFEIDIAQSLLAEVNGYLGYRAATYDETNRTLTLPINLRDSVRNKRKDNLKPLYEKKITILKEQFDAVPELKAEFDALDVRNQDIKNQELKSRLKRKQEKIEALWELKIKFDAMTAQTMDVEDLGYGLNAIESALAEILYP